MHRLWGLLGLKFCKQGGGAVMSLDPPAPSAISVNRYVRNTTARRVAGRHALNI